jgi:DNA polymerase III delta subunit
MLSKWTPWELVNSRPSILNADEQGLCALSFADPFVENLVLARIPKEISADSEFHIVNGKEVDQAWLENNFQTLSLFGGKDSYLVIEAQDLPSSAKEYLLDESFKVEDQRLILSFKKDTKFFNKLAKKADGFFFQVQEPKFWESDKLLGFLADEMGVRLAYPVKNYLKESLEGTSLDFHNALSLIKLHHPESSEVQLDQVRRLVRGRKLDHFALATSFGQKRQIDFYKKILSIELDFEALMHLFRFMQSHLFRLLDPSYMESKAKMSKYDKEILAHSKLWEKSELLEAMNLFGELEVDAKSKSANLKNRIRQTYLSHY